MRSCHTKNEINVTPKTSILSHRKNLFILDSKFSFFFEGKIPSKVTEADIQYFLIYLSVEKHVAPATQNQALNALVFFFRYALNKELTESISAVRSYGPRKLPVVLSEKEI
ncbi:MAG: hypothetical protein GXO78_01310 [Calditrichaeota bacterium]|nr:hypothetical protein [Calditrichota bacterium]